MFPLSRFQSLCHDLGPLQRLDVRTMRASAAPLQLRVAVAVAKGVEGAGGESEGEEGELFRNVRIREIAEMLNTQRDGERE